MGAQLYLEPFQSCSRKALQMSGEGTSVGDRLRGPGTARPEELWLACVTSAPQGNRTGGVHITETVKFYLFLFPFHISEICRARDDQRIKGLDRIVSWSGPVQEE